MISNKKQWCVYKHTNLINNKNYIGITCQKPTHRWGHNGHNYKNQPKFYNAIQKYGWDNFLHTIVFENLTKEEALKKESELINQLNSVQNGYNSSMTQEFLYSKEIYCVETNEYYPSIASASRFYKKDPSILSKHLHGDLSNAFGYHWYFVNEEENIEHYEADFKREQENQLKSKRQKAEELLIINLYLSGMTIHEITNQTGFSKQKISRILNKNNIKIRTNAISVIALDRDTLKPIKEFKTLKEACDWCGLNGESESNRIRLAIEESWRICKGYKWTTTDLNLLNIRLNKEKEYKNTQIPIKAIIKQYQQGNITTEELGNKYNLSRTTISKILKENNIKMAEGGRKAVIQIDPITKDIINTFDSIKSAYLFFNMNPNNPTLGKRCLDHKKYKGYIWWFQNDYISN